jgi:hypothetical protein
MCKYVHKFFPNELYKRKFRNLLLYFTEHKRFSY